MGFLYGASFTHRPPALGRVKKVKSFFIKFSMLVFHSITFEEQNLLSTFVVVS